MYMLCTCLKRCLYSLLCGQITPMVIKWLVEGMMMDDPLAALDKSRRILWLRCSTIYKCVSHNMKMFYTLIS